MRVLPELNMALVQGPLLWHDVEGNLEYFSKVLGGLEQSPDLVVLPEMFTTGFTMKPEAIAAQSIKAASAWIVAQAEALGCAVCGSVVALDEGRYYNRFLWAEPGRLWHNYSKRHLFRMAGEHEVYTPGKERELIHYQGWRIMPRICYDLRFPVWSRSAEAHLQLYVANWPSPRIQAWDVLLRARAIENLCYVAGVNRTGIDGNEVPYPGHSAVVNYLGASVAEAAEGEETVLWASLSMEALEAFRQKFPAHLDADQFSLKV